MFHQTRALARHTMVHSFSRKSSMWIRTGFYLSLSLAGISCSFVFCVSSRLELKLLFTCESGLLDTEPSFPL